MAPALHGATLRADRALDKLGERSEVDVLVDGEVGRQPVARPGQQPVGSLRGLRSDGGIRPPRAAAGLGRPRRTRAHPAGSRRARRPRPRSRPSAATAPPPRAQPSHAPPAGASRPPRPDSRVGSPWRHACPRSTVSGAPARIERDIETLSGREYTTSDEAIRRYAYTAEYRRTLDYFTRELEAIGFDVSRGPGRHARRPQPAAG